MLNFSILKTNQAVKHHLNHQFHLNGQTKSTLKSPVFCHSATLDHSDHDNKRLFEPFHHVASLAVIHDRSVIVSRIRAQKDSITDLVRQSSHETKVLRWENQYFWVLFHKISLISFLAFELTIMHCLSWPLILVEMLLNGSREKCRETSLAGGSQELKLLMIPFPNSRQRISCGHFTRLSGSKIYVLQAVNLKQSQNRYLYHIRIRTSEVDLLSQYHQC